MYHTERDPFSRRKLFVEKTAAGRESQKKILVAKKALLRYGLTERTQTKGEGLWVRTKMLKKRVRKNPPKH
jgi:hypothetical protein